MPRVITTHFIALLLWQLIFFSFTNAEYEILEGMIKDGNKEIHLKWKKTEQLLANDNLPIWIANHVPLKYLMRGAHIDHELKFNFMNEIIGDFVLYRDVEKSSAVVYFKKTRTIHGIIDTRYIIKDLPLDERNNGHRVGGEYIQYRYSNLDIHEHLKPLDLSKSSTTESPIDQAEPSTSHENEPLKKRPRFNKQCRIYEVTTQQIVLYPEILVLVPYDVVKIVQATHGDDYVKSIVRHYLIYFNAIDMLFAKLFNNNIQIHLNLAGIVIENEFNVFPFMVPIDIVPYQDPSYINTGETLQAVPSYIRKHKNIFPIDSFDFFFIATAAELWKIEINRKTAGASTRANIFAERRSAFPYENMLGVIVHHGTNCEFIIATQEIAHLMSMNHDPLNKGYYSDEGQCYSIMQKNNKHCQDCLNWSDESINDLKEYVRNNKNRCYLLNTPRSLRLYDTPMRTLTPAEQCICYGLQPRNQPTRRINFMEKVATTGCARNMFCHDYNEETFVPLPLDGTPCADNKVCWKRKCELLRPE